MRGPSVTLHRQQLSHRRVGDYEGVLTVRGTQKKRWTPGGKRQKSALCQYTASLLKNAEDTHTSTMHG